VLQRQARSDLGRRRLPEDLIAAIEALALRRPPPTTAYVHRRVSDLACDRGLPAPSYSTVRSVVAAIDPGLRTLAHSGDAAYRDQFELVHRRSASRPNEQWQADHTLLDLQVLDARQQPARPWLTVVLDDYSRAVAGYTVFLGEPTAEQTALALHQAAGRKSNPAWPVTGLPDVLYSDHGSDFTSSRLERVCLDTHIRLIHSRVGVPQGRGKIERFFGTVTTELLPHLPGHIPHGTRGQPLTPPTLTLGQLDGILERFVVEDYHARPHSETGQPPVQRWLGDGWIPRTPTHPEDLDLDLLLLLTGTDTQPGARWFAVHHGAASGDRDHIHFVATLVREDGRGIYLNKDKLALREVAKEMTTRFGLEVRTREPGAGARGLTRPELAVSQAPVVAATGDPEQQRTAETAAATNEGGEQQPHRTSAAGAAVEPAAPVEVPRRRLERTVRAAATAASTEAQWLARLGELGVAVEPRWARGGDRVVGYRVALAEPPTEQAASKAVWFGGGTLAHDLTLPALRAGWARESNPAAAWRRAPTAAPAPTSTRPAPEQVSRDFTAATTTLRGAVMTARLLGGDGAEVARAARDTGGLLAALAVHAPPADRRRLAQASAHFARAGQVEHGQARGARSPLSPGFAQVAVTVLTAASGGTASTAVLLVQVARLTRTVAELHAVQNRVAAARDTARAAELLAPYGTPTAPTPDPVPPQQVLMPNQEQLDAMLGSTRAQRFAAETRNRTHGGEPSTYRPPPPTQEPGRER